MGKLKRLWQQTTMSPKYDFVGAVVNVKHREEFSVNELLDFIASNWMRISPEKRIAFKTQLTAIELGLEKMPEPDDLPEVPPVKW
jgi:hypothetical protein